MVYTLFFSKMRDLSPAEMDEYHERVGALRAMAEAEHPGFASMKTYVAERFHIVVCEQVRSHRFARRHEEGDGS